MNTASAKINCEKNIVTVGNKGLISLIKDNIDGALGYEAAEKSLKDAGVDVKIKVDGTTDESDEIGQQTMTDNLVNQGYNALMLSPISDSNLTSSVDNAKTKKILIIRLLLQKRQISSGAAVWQPVSTH